MYSVKTYCKIADAGTAGSETVFNFTDDRGQTLNCDYIHVFVTDSASSVDRYDVFMGGLSGLNTVNPIANGASGTLGFQVHGAVPIKLKLASPDFTNKLTIIRKTGSVSAKLYVVYGVTQPTNRMRSFGKYTGQI